jgi:hypothetical protein
MTMRALPELTGILSAAETVLGATGNAVALGALMSIPPLTGPPVRFARRPHPVNGAAASVCGS